jgi:nitronate monooxygenase
MTEISLQNRIITLLEAERAGVFAAKALLGAAKDSAETDLMALVLNGERESCRVLGRTLLQMGTRGSAHVGDFAQKVMALDNTDDRLRLLIRGQEWVVRKIGEVLDTQPPAEIMLPLTEVRHIHDIGIGKCRDYLDSRSKTQSWTCS